MIKSGLVSVTFRDRSVSEIISACTENKIQYIEWGSDVHAPAENLAKLHDISNLQRSANISCCGYGTYFRVGVDAIDNIYKYIKAAQILGTNVLRIWCGDKSSEKCSTDEKQRYIEECVKLAKIAEKEGIILCTEFHGGTLTDCPECVTMLLNQIGSKNFKTFWQPNQNKSFQWNLNAAKILAKNVQNIHVFNWKKDSRLPLKNAKEQWIEYLKVFTGEHVALLEFMPDDEMSSLFGEFFTLKEILGEIK